MELGHQKNFFHYLFTDKVPTSVGTYMGKSMEIFNIRNLRSRIGDLISAAEHGKLSLITKHGQPIFVAVPFNEMLLQCGVKSSLAVGLFVENKVGLAGAARIAGVSPSEMIDILAESNVPLVDYSKEDVADELAQFK